MKIIICGAGMVGSNIARQLAREGNDVTVIDRTPELIQRISDSIDVKGLVGMASFPDTLERAGAQDCDMLIAVTFADEVNMVACQVAHSLFHVPTKIARVRAQAYLNPEWSDLFSTENLPIDVIISPEVEVARAIMRRLEVPGALDMIPFADGRVRTIGVRLGEDCPVVHTPLRQLTALFPDLKAVVCGIVRNDKLVVPHGDDQLFPGDEIYFIADTQQVQRAMGLFGHEEKEARRLIIVGAGNIGLYLARQLELTHPGVRIKLIERDLAHAEAAADRLHQSVVLHGDALDRELLDEANISGTEAIVALTNDDQVNILASLLAKRAGCQRAVALVNNEDYRGLITSLGIDVVVNPRGTTVSTILQYVRRGRIRQVYSLRDGTAEVIEAEALKTSGLVGKSLRDMDIPDGIIVGAIVRGEEVVLPRGDTVIEAGDRVILFAMSEMVRHVEKMFAVRLEYF